MGKKRRAYDTRKASARTKVFARLFQKAAGVRGEKSRGSSGARGREVPQVERRARVKGRRARGEEPRELRFCRCFSGKAGQRVRRQA